MVSASMEQRAKVNTNTKVATCSGPVNMAVIKYWGKRDENLILPVNSSLSATLNQNDLKTITSVMASENFKENRIWLNGKEESWYTNKRLCNVLKEFRLQGNNYFSQSESQNRANNVRYEHANTTYSQYLSEKENSQREILGYNIHVCSENNFPTAAGLASSASGYATLVKTFYELYQIPIKNISKIARVGSGSACRSLDGGFVKWNKGELDDGSDSFAVQVAPESHWPEMCILICVVSDQKKHTSSTSGMKTTVETSSLMQYRMDHVVEKRLQQMEESIAKKDFETFGKLTMMDSNQFHSVCLDTYPPIFYQNDTSRKIMVLVTKYNDYHNSVKVAYTFDAGPNACIYAPKENMKEFLAVVKHYFPSDSSTFLRGLVKTDDIDACSLSKELIEAMKMPVQEVNTLQYALLTNIGPGAMPMSCEEDCLLDSTTGLPK